MDFNTKSADEEAQEEWSKSAAEEAQEEWSLKNHPNEDTRTDEWHTETIEIGSQLVMYTHHPIIDAIDSYLNQSPLENYDFFTVPDTLDRVFSSPDKTVLNAEQLSMATQSLDMKHKELKGTVIVFDVNKNIQLEVAKTKAFPEHGYGNAKQIHIPNALQKQLFEDGVLKPVNYYDKFHSLSSGGFKLGEKLSNVKNMQETPNTLEQLVGNKVNEIEILEQEENQEQKQDIQQMDKQDYDQNQEKNNELIERQTNNTTNVESNDNNNLGFGGDAGSNNQGLLNQLIERDIDLLTQEQEPKKEQEKEPEKEPEKEIEKEQEKEHEQREGREEEQEEEEQEKKQEEEQEHKKEQKQEQSQEQPTQQLTR